jgi:ankyrin repeat protein
LRNASTAEIRAILEDGVDPKQVDFWGRTALHIIAEENKTNFEAAKLLTSRSDVNQVDCNGRTVVHLIVKYNGSEELLRLFLHSGALVNVPCCLQKNPLDYAIESNVDVVLLRLLLLYGADLCFDHVQTAKALKHDQTAIILNTALVFIQLNSLYSVVRISKQTRSPLRKLPHDLIREMYLMLVD